ncbi:PEP-CTERM sorting domain-containing protein [Permianibacter sp. IMCC34836]|uniref:choice-of-anchor J family PEP-CTERM protein n=1 Tax=Permianibacter fluminis TaxID=2738515 RepID=UPI00155621BC|nr:choice-of-anchor J domain-containing protein [Permianibacter fluminis]NQD35955.1 PEP-CTERM sorting domain-containing protein [Permianibacter fluminis]
MKALSIAAALLLASGVAQADPIFTEDFDDITTLAGDGWALINNSTAGGQTSWFQGNDGVFSAYEGSDNSYIAANFLNAGAGGQISNWLITPLLTLNEASYLTFYTRRNDSEFFDSLEVRFTTSDSINVGSSANDVGDFTSMGMVEVLLAGADYPLDWVQVRVTFGDIGFGNGRIALRYVVDNTDLNGDYIGIDSLTVGVPEPTSLAVLGLGVFGLLAARRRARV